MLKEQVNPKIAAVLERAQPAGVVREDIAPPDVPILIQSAARAGCVGARPIASTPDFA